MTCTILGTIIALPFHECVTLYPGDVLSSTVAGRPNLSEQGQENVEVGSKPDDVGGT